MTAISESVRLETVAADVGDIALVIVDNPPVNALSWHVRQGLFDGISKAVEDGAKAVVVICDGRTFIAGADISEFGGNVPKAAGLHEVQAAMENAAVPVIAAIHGTALGGGLEVALCAHYRVAVDSAKFGLPEVNLGLLPGAGGTQRLPRLVGVPKALEMMTSGRHIGTGEALEAGLIDDVTTGGPAELREAAIAFANKAVAENLPLARVRDRDEKVLEARGNDQLFADFRASIARKTRGFLAPEYNIQCIEAAANLPFDEGLKVEGKLFMELMTGPQSGAQRYAFFAERAANKIPDIRQGHTDHRREEVRRARRRHDGRRHRDELRERRHPGHDRRTRSGSTRPRPRCRPQELRALGIARLDPRRGGRAADGADHRIDRQGRLRRLRHGDRSGVRGHGAQEVDLP